jgi:hypothetical protein
VGGASAGGGNGGVGGPVPGGGNADPGAPSAAGGDAGPGGPTGASPSNPEEQAGLPLQGTIQVLGAVQTTNGFLIVTNSIGILSNQLLVISNRFAVVTNSFETNSLTPTGLTNGASQFHEEGPMPVHQH